MTGSIIATVASARDASKRREPACTDGSGQSSTWTTSTRQDFRLIAVGFSAAVCFQFWSVPADVARLFGVDAIQTSRGESFRVTVEYVC